MAGLGLLGYYLWIAPHVLLVVLFAILWRKKLLRAYPMFAAYTVAEIFQFALLFLASMMDPHLMRSYLPVYLVGTALSTAFRFGIIAEILGELFREYPMLVRPGKWVLRGVAGLLILGAVGLAAAQPSGWTSSLKSLTLGLDRAASILQVGLLLVLLAFSRYLGLAWRNLSFGIALGLGIFATTDLAVSAIRLNMEAPSPHFFDLITMGVYHGCVLIWIGYALIPERVPKVAAEQLPQHDLEAWNKELERMLQP